MIGQLAVRRRWPLFPFFGGKPKAIATMLGSCKAIPDGTIKPSRFAMQPLAPTCL